MSPVGQLLRSILVPFLGGRELMSPPPCFDEMRMPDGAARPAYARLARWLEELPPERLRQKHDEAAMQSDGGDAARRGGGGDDAD